MEDSILVIVGLILLETSYLIFKKAEPKEIKSSNSSLVFVDTSVLIDGRILYLAKSGFIGRKLMVPRSVVGELQLLADQADPNKRLRARYGLDVVSELQATENVDVDIFHDDRRADEGVDERLLKLAKKNKGAICTLDFNLNKVAKTENIEVLNINDLAMNLRMAYLPGETADIKLSQKGQEAKQAVGYLNDGTLVVVDKAINKIGQKVNVRFIRSLQTEAGKMMFAELNEASTKAHSSHNKPKQNKASNYSKNPRQRRQSAPKQHSRPKNNQEDKVVDLMNK